MTDDLVTLAKGRLAFLVDRGEIKTPELIVAMLARIESDAATIARLEAERDEARANADVYAGFNDSAEAKLAEIRALQAAPDGWDEVMATRSLVMAKDAAEAKVAALVEALRRIHDKRCEMDRGDLSADEAITEADDIARAAIAAAKGGDNGLV